MLITGCRTGGFYQPRPAKDANAYLKLKIMCLGYHWNSEERISFYLFNSIFIYFKNLDYNTDTKLQEKIMIKLCPNPFLLHILNILCYDIILDDYFVT